MCLLCEKLLWDSDYLLCIPSNNRPSLNAPRLLCITVKVRINTLDRGSEEASPREKRQLISVQVLTRMYCTLCEGSNDDK